MRGDADVNGFTILSIGIHVERVVAFCQIHGGKQFELVLGDREEGKVLVLILAHSAESLNCLPLEYFGLHTALSSYSL